MKKIFAVALFALLLVGCDKSNPTDTTTASSSAVEFSETSMLKMTILQVDDIIITTTADSVCHDSLRHGRMLNSLNIHLGLTPEQFDSVKVYGVTLFNTLKDIRQQVKDTLITKIQARELVKLARHQFIASVQSILTTEQLVKFDRWVVRFWNKDGHRGGGPRGQGGRHGGSGGQDDPFEPGGHGGPGRRP
jgi:hypothetical protein